jgi:hypothetical protein
MHFNPPGQQVVIILESPFLVCVMHFAEMEIDAVTVISCSHAGLRE